MKKLKNKFAIGCLVQWYEVEMINEYLESVCESVQTIENKENVIIDICFNMAQNLEKIDEKQCKLSDIYKTFQQTSLELDKLGLITNVTFYPNNFDSSVDEDTEPYTIADYRREFNDRYCEEVDVLMWGESDSLIPKKTFQILDGLHNNVKNQTPKWLAFFSTCKMWDDSWLPLEHPEFTNKPFIDNDYENWWNHHYTMSLEELNNVNVGIEKYHVDVLKEFKFNGCGLIMSADVVRGGANIPKCVFFTHEDTAFLNLVRIMYGKKVPQFVIKNILLVHNRHHPNKRSYVLGEGVGGSAKMRYTNNWYKIAAEKSQYNAHNFDEMVKLNKWEDVYAALDE